MRYSFPFVIVVVLVGFLLQGLSLKPDRVPSALIDRPVPNFKISSLEDSKDILTEKLFQGKISLVNVWASWCSNCKAEHRFLMSIQKTLESDVQIIGLNVHDTSIKAKRWLEKLGNPYQKVIYDAKGRLATDLGVTGTPEFFVIDKKGIIRYRQIGEMDKRDWKNKIEPLLKKLHQEE